MPSMMKLRVVGLVLLVINKIKNGLVKRPFFYRCVIYYPFETFIAS